MQFNGSTWWRFGQEFPSISSYSVESFRAYPFVEIDQAEYAEVLETLNRPHGEADIAKRFRLNPFMAYRLIVHKVRCDFLNCKCGARIGTGYAEYWQARADASRKGGK